MRPKELEVRIAFRDFVGWLDSGVFFDMYQISIKYTKVFDQVKVHISLGIGMVEFFLTLR